MKTLIILILCLCLCGCKDAVTQTIQESKTPSFIISKTITRTTGTVYTVSNGNGTWHLVSDKAFEIGDEVEIKVTPRVRK